MTALRRMRNCRVRACPAKRLTSCRPSPSSRATTLWVARCLPSRSMRGSVTTGSTLVTARRRRRSGSSLKCSAGGKQSARRIARLAGDDHRDDAVGTADRLEAADFLVDVPAARRIGRADHGQKLGCLQRRERAARSASRRPPSGSRLRKIGRNVVGTRPAGVSRPTRSGSMRYASSASLQPRGPGLVAIAVTQEYAILERTELSHAPLPRSRDQPDKRSTSRQICRSSVLRARRSPLMSDGVQFGTCHRLGDLNSAVVHSCKKNFAPTRIDSRCALFPRASAFAMRRKRDHV